MQVLDHPVGTIDITWAGDMFIGEPETFAQDLAEALKESGWTVRKMQGVTLVVMPEERRDAESIHKATGLKIMVRDPENPPASARALEWALGQSGFVSEFIVGRNLEDGVIGLLVWQIPPSGGWVYTFREKK